MAGEMPQAQIARRKTQQHMTQAKALPQVRLRFAKRGDLRLVSHHDMMRCLERMVRRAKIPLASSHGFNPRPKITFALALGLGIEALREVVDLELTEFVSPDEILRRLSAVSPHGFQWLEARSLSLGESPPRPLSVSYRLVLPPDRIEGAASALSKFIESESWPFERRRPDRRVCLDLRPFLIDAAIAAEGSLEFRVKVTPEGTARGEEIVEALGLVDLLESGSVLTRADIELSSPQLQSQSRQSVGGPAASTATPEDVSKSSVPIPTAISRSQSQMDAIAAPDRTHDEFIEGAALSLLQPDGILLQDNFTPNTENRSVQKESA